MKRRKTYAHYAIIIGILLGMLVGFQTNAALGVVVCIVISVGGFIGIRQLEKKVVYKAEDAMTDKLNEKINAKKEARAKEKNNASGPDDATR